MTIKQSIAHWLVGHIPYFIYEDSDGKHTPATKHYRCTLCGMELSGGVYHQLYSPDNHLEVQS